MLQAEVDRLRVPTTEDHVLSTQRILELANKAHFLYFTRNAAERGQLPKMVLLNCAIIRFLPSRHAARWGEERGPGRKNRAGRTRFLADSNAKAVTFPV